MPSPKKAVLKTSPVAKPTAGKAVVVKAATRPQPPVRPVPEKTIAVPAVTPGQRIRENVSGIDSIEDAFRQTGRTSRMLKNAAETARKGSPVLIIVLGEQRAKEVLGRAVFYPNTTVNVRAHDPKTPLFDWETLDPIAPEYNGWKVFVDHDVVLTQQRHLLTLLGWGINAAVATS